VQKLLPQTYYLSRIRELENFSFLEWELLRIGEEIASNFLFPCSHSRRLRRILINSFAGRKITSPSVGGSSTNLSNSLILDKKN
jgi:hypothetical protein